MLVGAAVARLDNFAAAPAAPPTIATEALTFTDLADGGVSVRNASTGELVATIPARNDGFLRMTLRLLAARKTAAENRPGATLHPYRIFGRPHETG